MPKWSVKASLIAGVATVGIAMSMVCLVRRVPTVVVIRNVQVDFLDFALAGSQSEKTTLLIQNLSVNSLTSSSFSTVSMHPLNAWYEADDGWHRVRSLPKEIVIRQRRQGMLTITGVQSDLGKSIDVSRLIVPVGSFVRLNSSSDNALNVKITSPCDQTAVLYKDIVTIDCLRCNVQGLPTSAVRSNQTANLKVELEPGDRSIAISAATNAETARSQISLEMPVTFHDLTLFPNAPRLAVKQLQLFHPDGTTAINPNVPTTLEFPDYYQYDTTEGLEPNEPIYLSQKDDSIIDSLELRAIVGSGSWFTISARGTLAAPSAMSREPYVDHRKLEWENLWYGRYRLVLLISILGALIGFYSGVSKITDLKKSATTDSDRKKANPSPKREKRH